MGSQKNDYDIIDSVKTKYEEEFFYLKTDIIIEKMLPKFKPEDVVSFMSGSQERIGTIDRYHGSADGITYSIQVGNDLEDMIKEEDIVNQYIIKPAPKTRNRKPVVENEV